MSYIAGSISLESATLLEKTFKDVPNVLEKEFFHISYLQTLDSIEEFKGEVISHKATISGLKVWKTKNGSNCLVLTLESKEIEDYHKQLLDKYKVKYIYPTFHAHISISYDIKDYNNSKIDLPKDDIIIDLIYHQKLSNENGASALSFRRKY